MVKHLAGVEYEWLPTTYGRVTEVLETDPVADMNAGPHESSADIVAFYGRARAAFDAVIAEHGIEDVGTAWFGDQVSLRRVLIGLVEETARHAGHMDILRELIDGAAGSHRPD
nr:DUF664 domain-containing protein [Kineococcus radiotolerans]